ncbi:MAG: VOC family protein, partial [Actinomycetota bacterium]
MIRVDHIDHVAIAVKDVHASAAWYQKMFGLER